ncbi:MAG: DUF1893 domain-containing protein [Erysipelotrichaceae bacterium]|nr:DUF1893 domain-containing protein [Erysipelotrichaceae bacterium]
MMKKLRDELCEKNYSILAVRDGFTYTSFLSGIKPVLLPMRENREHFKDCRVVDKVIGKASAMLLILSGVKEVYGLVMSKSAVKLLEERGIPYGYDRLEDVILNIAGDDMCPMEKTVLNIDTPEEAFEALDAKLKSLAQKR